jgi:hypothetical protein
MGFDATYHVAEKRVVPGEAPVSCPAVIDKRVTRGPRFTLNPENVWSPDMARSTIPLVGDMSTVPNKGDSLQSMGDGGKHGLSQ